MNNDDSNIMFISTPDGHIIYHPTSKTSWVISDCPELLEIIKRKHICFDIVKRLNGRYDARLIIYNGVVIARPYLSRVAYDCYYNGLTPDKLIDFYIRNDTSKSNEGDYPTIDHLDGDSHNNRKENLFEMTRKENNRKRQKPQKLKISRCITLANDKGRCKIQYAYMDYKGKINVLRYICYDSQSINACLDYISANKYRITSKRTGTQLEDTTDYEITIKCFPFGHNMACDMHPINPQALATKVARMPDAIFTPVTTTI